MKKNSKNILLTNRQKILGSQYCYANAKELYEEADILLNQSKWARATALFILGIEEISKIELLGQTFFYKTVQEWEKFEEKFTRHNTKLKLADIILLQMAYRSGDAEKLKKELQDIMKGRNFNIGKQKCFYVGYSSINGWEVPSKISKEEDAKYCKKVLGFMIETYREIFSKSFNEIVDIIKQMKKTIPTDEIRNESIKMQNHIKKVANNLKAKT
jgi:AbiV family abortive infection protein